MPSKSYNKAAFLYKYRRARAKSKRGSRTTNRFPKRKRRRFLPPIIASPKYRQEGTNGTGRRLHSLYDELLTNIIQGTRIDDRERQKIFVKGIRMHFTVRMDPVSAPDDHRLVSMRYAIVQQRHNDQPYVTDGDDASVNIFAGMFDRSSVDFLSIQNGLDTLSLPINQRKWDVLHEERIALNNNSGTNGPQPRMICEHRYVPINKHVEFRSPIANDIINPIVCLWWYEDPFWAAVGTSATDVLTDRFIWNVEFTDVL